MSTFTFGSISSTTYHADVYPTDSMMVTPARQYTEYNVPGRSGTLLMDDGTYENVSRDYGILIANGASTESNLHALRAALAAQVGYQRLTDSFDTTHYFMAAFRELFEPELRWKNKRAARGVLSFDRKPQRYLLSGETATVVTTTGSSITNPTLFTAKPLLRVTGTGGYVGIGTVTLLLTGINSYIDIDCETGEAYKDNASTPQNDRVQIYSGSEFPTLKPGSNGVTFGSGITRVSITPRWWEI